MNVQYARHAPLWDYVEDCYHGAERVKEGPNAEEYLPLQSLEREELRSGRVAFTESRYAFRRKVASFENLFSNCATGATAITTDSQVSRRV